MISKAIKIDGRQVEFKASAAVPRLYRVRFGRDIMRDIVQLKNSMKKAQQSGEQLDIPSLEIFENVAYIMALHADPQGVPPSLEDWLEQFDVFSIYNIAPTIFELWAVNSETHIQPAKK